MKNLSLLLVSLFACLTLCVHAADETDKSAKKSAEKTDQKPNKEEPMHFESNGSVRVDGNNIDYIATAGTLVMKNEKDEPVAQFGYTAYVQKGQDKRKRPILFAYNGGPGSASFWLHMGILGPVRVVVEDLSFNTTGPFSRTNNEHSILDRADLVMIDPVGTGFSRAGGDAK
jgi:carboxypeptidase C (cathepsin A)